MFTFFCQFSWAKSSHFSWGGKISSHRSGIAFSWSWKFVMFTKRKLLVWNRQLSFFAHKISLMRQRFRWPLGYKPVDRWFRSPPVFTCSDISSLLFRKQPTTELGVWWPADSFGGPAVSVCGSWRRSAHSTLLAGRLFIRSPSVAEGMQPRVRSTFLSHILVGFSHPFCHSLPQDEKERKTPSQLWWLDSPARRLEGNFPWFYRSQTPTGHY